MADCLIVYAYSADYLCTITKAIDAITVGINGDAPTIALAKTAPNIIVTHISKADLIPNMRMPV